MAIEPSDRLIRAAGAERKGAVIRGRIEASSFLLSCKANEPSHWYERATHTQRPMFCRWEICDEKHAVELARWPRSHRPDRGPGFRKEPRPSVRIIRIRTSRCEQHRQTMVRPGPPARENVQGLFYHRWG